MEEFARHGFTVSTNAADIYLINTCSVTARADKRAREAVRHIKKENPGAKIALTGCLPQLNADKVKTWGVDWVVPQDKKADIVKIILGDSKTKSDLWSLGISDFFIHRAFVKVQDGCDNRCSFCKIPHIRGASQSRPQKDIIDETARLSEKYREIVLCAVNLALYGRDFKDGSNLYGLVKEILKVKNLGRLRLSSLESIFAGGDLLEFLNHPKFCPHLHIPFQSGDDKVLQAMNKRETVQGYRDFVAKARKINPMVAISADFIVGFPAEGEKEFENTLEFLRAVKPMRTHLFTFSPREGTPLAGVKIKNPAQIKKRFKILQAAAQGFALDYAESFIGKELLMAAEGAKNGFSCGYTENYLRVKVKKDLPPGQLVSVTIDKVLNGVIYAV